MEQKSYIINYFLKSNRPKTSKLMNRRELRLPQLIVMVLLMLKSVLTRRVIAINSFKKFKIQMGMGYIGEKNSKVVGYYK